MHMTNIKTDTYHIRDTYFVDIVQDDITYQAYLYNEMYCIKTLMFGIGPEEITYEEFIEVVENASEEYISYYKQDLEDPEEEIGD